MGYIVNTGSFGRSGRDQVNLLFEKGKFYVMDNHLAAAWCWLQKINTNEKYQLVHIDRHYDLINPIVSDDDIQKLRTNLTFNEYCSFRNENNNQLIRFDNYILLLNQIYPNLLDEWLFVTHKNDSKEIEINEIKFREGGIWDVPENLSNWINKGSSNKCILNIDIDFFFVERFGELTRFLTDEYIKLICTNIRESLSNIGVVTFALSPEFCGNDSDGWKKALDVMQIFSDEFNLDFKYPS